MKLHEFTDWPKLTLTETEVQIDDEPMIHEAFSGIENDWTVLDAGASLGYYSILAGQKATKGTVVAIEPHPLIADVLRQNLALHNISNVHIYRKALSGVNAERTIVMRETDGRGGTQVPYAKPALGTRLLTAVKDGSLIRKAVSRIRRRGEPVREFTVETSTIDRLVQELELKRVDLIKMDIQGAEYDALQGALNTLREHGPILVIELHPRPLWSYQQLIGFLKTEHYRVIRDSAGHADFLKAEPIIPILRGLNALLGTS